MKSNPQHDAHNRELDLKYENILDDALDLAKESKSGLHEYLNKINEDIKSLGEISLEETLHLERSIKRDIIDAASYLRDSGKEIKEWLGFDISLIKYELWQKFQEATDKTILELLKLKQISFNAEYHTGEIIGLGTLVCDQCKLNIHFYKPGHIPPCPKCKSTSFHRIKNEI